MPPLGAKLADETIDDTESFLPESAESTEVVRILDDEFDAGETTQGLIVYEREGGLTAADKQKIVDDAENDPDRRPGRRDPPDPGPGRFPSSPAPRPTLVSEDGSVAYTVLTVPTDFEEPGRLGQERPRHRRGGAQPRASRSCSPATSASAPTPTEVFGELDAKLLFATVILVLVLLGAHLPRGAGRPHAADRRLLRLHDLDRLHLPARQVGRDRLLEQHQHPGRAHVRGGDRLLPAARLQIPRGAAPPRGQARGDAARAGAAPGRRSSPAA